MRASTFRLIGLCVTLALCLECSTSAVLSDKRPALAATPSLSVPGGNSPRTLLNADDIARMKNWAATYPWATALRNQIVSNADAWPSKYMSDYNLTSPDWPPTGGYPDSDYLCPDSTYATYVPAHSPPHYCSSTGQYYASPPQWPEYPTLYDQVIYERRHFDLAQYAMFLGLAYQLTDDTTYAVQAGNILRQYSAIYLTYPLHADIIDPDWTASSGRATDVTLRESRWLLDLAWAYDLVVGSGVLSGADQTAIADGLFRPAAAIIAGNDMGLSNWQVWHNVALTITALILDDPETVADRFNNPTNGFYAHLSQGAAADGFWHEYSWGYHFVALQGLVYMAEMGARNGLDPYASPNLRKMFAAPLQMAAPDLTLPPFNDSGTQSLAGGGMNWVYEAGYRRFHDPTMVIPRVGQRRFWQGLLWGAASVPADSSAVPAASALLPAAGYAVLRAGTSDLRYLALDFGPHGGWHGHYDKLGYVSYALGNTLGTDPGTHSYVSPLHDGWDRTTVAHNALVVDEQNQAEAAGNLHRYLDFSALSLATADAGDVYANRVMSVRTLALNADYWLDVTRATSLDGNSHRYDWVYHNPGSLSSSLYLTPYSDFPSANGYEYLTNTRAAASSTDWHATWDSSGMGEPYGSVWWNKDGIAASFSITDATATNGVLSGQMDYDFGTVTDGYILFSSRVFSGLPNEVPNHIHANVHGDTSNNKLTLRIMDATGEKFGKDLGNITWTGWRNVELVVEKTWWHGSGSGDNDGVMDTPISQVVLQIGQRSGSARSGRLFADEIALTFPAAGKLTVEDFEGSLAKVRMTMLGAPGTTVVLGDGMDNSNQPVPFAMARRQGTETTFAAVFEPARQSPRITSFQALSVSPALSSRSAFRIDAAGLFADTLMLADDDVAGDRTFGDFTTDGAVAYLRQGADNSLQSLVLTDATNLADGSVALLTSTAPITTQVAYAGNLVSFTMPDVPTAQLRLYSPADRVVLVNGAPTPTERDGEYLILMLPPHPINQYLPIVRRNQ